MTPIKINKSWYIEVYSEEFGPVLLLENGSELAIPATFTSEEEANKHIRELEQNSSC